MTFLRMFFGIVLQLTPFSFLCFYPFQNHTRYSKKRTIFLTALLISVLGFLFAGICCYLERIIEESQSLFHAANFAFIACLSICLIWYIYAINEIWQKKLYIFVFVMTSALAMTSICNTIDAKLQRAYHGNGLPYDPSALLILAALTTVVLPLLWLLLKYYYMPVSEGLNRSESGYLSLLSLLLFIILARGLIPIDYFDIFSNPQSLFLFVILLFAVFMDYVVCFKLFYHAHEKMLAQQSLVQLQHQLEIRDEQYKRIVANIDHSRKIRHDMRHHAVILQKFLHDGNIKSAEEYLDQHVGILSEYEVVKLCENTIVNTVVSYYKNFALEQKISFVAHIDMPDQVGIEDSDLSVLLGNLLENAIEATSDASEQNHFITLNIIHRGKMLAITVDNGFNGHPKMDGISYRSVKHNHTGIGLASITSIADKYNGGVEFEHEDDIFHASVMLNIIF